MPSISRERKLVSTDLTWEEQNPFSYRFNVEVLTELQQAIKKVRKEEREERETRATY